MRFFKSKREPRIYYHILYGPHATIKDFEASEKIFNQFDIYIPERFRWSNKAPRAFNRLSQGKLTPAEMFLKFPVVKYKAVAIKEFEIIYNSRKPILLVDVPRGHRLIKIDKENRELQKRAWSLFLKGNFWLSLEKLREHIVARANFELKRENFIKKNLERKVKKIIKRNRKLREKSKVRVLLRLGTWHTKLYHDLKKEGFLVSRQFVYHPEIIPCLSQAMRIVAFIGDRKLDNTLIARAFIENLASYYFREAYMSRDTDLDGNAIIKFARIISSSLPLKTIAEISKECGKNPEKPFYITKYLEDPIAKKNIVFYTKLYAKCRLNKSAGIFYTFHSKLTQDFGLVFVLQGIGV